MRLSAGIHGLGGGGWNVIYQPINQSTYLQLGPCNWRWKTGAGRRRETATRPEISLDGRAWGWASGWSRDDRWTRTGQPRPSLAPRSWRTWPQAVEWTQGKTRLLLEKNAGISDKIRGGIEFPNRTVVAVSQCLHWFLILIVFKNWFLLSE